MKNLFILLIAIFLYSCEEKKVIFPKTNQIKIKARSYVPDESAMRPFINNYHLRVNYQIYQDGYWKHAKYLFYDTVRTDSIIFKSTELGYGRYVISATKGSYSDSQEIYYQGGDITTVLQLTTQN